jgi:hypothetical protein
MAQQMRENERLARGLATHMLDGSSGEDGISYDRDTRMIELIYPVNSSVLEAAIPGRWVLAPDPHMDPAWRHATLAFRATWAELVAAESTGWMEWIQTFLSTSLSRAAKLGGPMTGEVREFKDYVRVRLDGLLYVPRT